MMVRLRNDLVADEPDMRGGLAYMCWIRASVLRSTTFTRTSDRNPLGVFEPGRRRAGSRLSNRAWTAETPSIPHWGIIGLTYFGSGPEACLSPLSFHGLVATESSCAI